MVVLDQFIEVSALDVLQMESDVTRLITYLLAGETLANITTHAASNARPCVAFLDSGYHFGDALVSQGVVRTEQDLVLIQLRHDDHARTFVQGALVGGITYAENIIFVDEQEIFLLAVVVTRELTHVLRKDAVVNGLAQHQFF